MCLSQWPLLHNIAALYCRGDRVTPTSSRGGSREAAVADRPSDDTRQRAVSSEMSEDELRRKTKSIIDEYLHLNDLKVLIIIFVSLFLRQHTSLSSFYCDCDFHTVVFFTSVTSRFSSSSSSSSSSCCANSITYHCRHHYCDCDVCCMSVCRWLSGGDDVCQQ